MIPKPCSLVVRMNALRRPADAQTAFRRQFDRSRGDLIRTFWPCVPLTSVRSLWKGRKVKGMSQPNRMVGATVPVRPLDNDPAFLQLRFADDRSIHLAIVVHDSFEFALSLKRRPSWNHILFRLAISHIYLIEGLSGLVKS